MDDVERELAELPDQDVDAWRRERIRRISRDTIRRAPRSRGARVWNRFVEPALLVAVSLTLMVWAVTRVGAILLGG